MTTFAPVEIIVFLAFIGTSASLIVHAVRSSKRRQKSILEAHKQKLVALQDTVRRLREELDVLHRSLREKDDMALFFVTSLP